MLVIERFRCCVCGRKTRHATYPLFDKWECLRCGSVDGPVLPISVEDVLRWASRESAALTLDLNGFHYFDWTDFVPYAYAGIPRTP